MPELIEVETYRRQAEAVVGRTITGAPALDPFGLVPEDPTLVAQALAGRRIDGVRRTGKVLFLDTDGPVVALRFGMTGRLLVDGGASIDRLEYSSDRDDPAWDRYVLTLDEGDLRVRDPRRLGGLALDMDEGVLGPDAASIDAETLTRVLAGGRGPLKGRLLDQARLAGLGNLLVDESTWRAGLDPTRPAGSLSPDEVAGLARTIVETVADLDRRGGSHMGDLQPARSVGATCPRDGAPLSRGRVGGRTTVWYPVHQR